MKAYRSPLITVLALLLALSLCACGQAAAPAAEPTPVPDAAAPAESPAAEAAAPEESPAPEAASEDLLALAETFVGRDVAELLEVIGEPLSADYAPSCLGPGEDGELVYESFTVYTYREGDTETVEEVYHAH